MTYRPPQCTEREPGGYEDCAWCSGVMLNNAAHGYPHAPSTRSEYEALRVAGGDGPAENPGDGSNPQQVRNGIIRRYGWAPRIFAPTWASNFDDDVWPLMAPGQAFVFTGRMGALSTYWRRWDPEFTGPHSMFGQREDSRDRIWCMNPLAPRSYPGEWMTRSQVRTFWNSFRNWTLFGTIGSLAKPTLPDTSTEDDVTLIVVTHNSIVPRSFTTKPGLVNLRRFTATAEVDPIPAPYSSVVDAQASIQPEDDRVPHGLGFFRLGAGGSEGYYVLASEVVLS
jgi:hypothetical protein